MTTNTSSKSQELLSNIHKDTSDILKQLKLLSDKIDVLSTQSDLNITSIADLSVKHEIITVIVKENLDMLNKSHFVMDDKPAVVRTKKTSDSKVKLTSTTSLEEKKESKPKSVIAKNYLNVLRSILKAGVSEIQVLESELKKVEPVNVELYLALDTAKKIDWNATKPPPGRQEATKQLRLSIGASELLKGVVNTFSGVVLDDESKSLSLEE